ncbi:MAG: type II secretion system protein, partial [bacterium]
MIRRTTPRAFTLVEILVVISIIGVLISLLTVGIQTAIETGKGSKDQSRA